MCKGKSHKCAWLIQLDLQGHMGTNQAEDRMET